MLKPTMPRAFIIAADGSMKVNNDYFTSCGSGSATLPTQPTSPAEALNTPALYEDQPTLDVRVSWDTAAKPSPLPTAALKKQQQGGH